MLLTVYINFLNLKNENQIIQYNPEHLLPFDIYHSVLYKISGSKKETNGFNSSEKTQIISELNFQT